MKVGALICSVIVALSVIGCSSNGGGDGVKADNAKQLADMSTMAKQANGDFDKLTPEGKQQILGMANGDEKQARALLQMMANPPNAGRGGPPSRAPSGK